MKTLAVCGLLLVLWLLLSGSVQAGPDSLTLTPVGKWYAR